MSPERLLCLGLALGVACATVERETPSAVRARQAALVFSIPMNPEVPAELRTQFDENTFFGVIQEGGRLYQITSTIGEDGKSSLVIRSCAVSPEERTEGESCGNGSVALIDNGADGTVDSVSFSVPEGMELNSEFLVGITDPKALQDSYDALLQELTIYATSHTNQ